LTGGCLSDIINGKGGPVDSWGCEFLELEHTRYLINKDGLEYPGLVLLGTNGILLQDGNHRFFAMRDTYPLFPIITRVSDNPIKVKCGSYRDILPYIMEML